jgi:hypothetical protein
VGDGPARLLEDRVYRDPAGRWIIRPYRPGDEVRILDLFRRVFGVERSLDHWRWKFLRNPAGLHIRLAETPAGEVVGQYAGLPARVAWGGKTLVLTQIIDVMVDPRFRVGLKRPGLFASLATRFIGDYGGPDRVSAGYGFPTPEALRIGRRVAGYTPLHPVTCLVRDLAPAGVLRPPAWARLAYRVQPVGRFGAEVERLWEQVSAELPVAVIRDPTYLNWRYADCPDVRYTMLAAVRRLTGTLAAAAVVRIGVRDEPVAALVDWLVSRRAPGAALALLARCEAVAREAGMAQVHAWFPPSSWPHRFLRDLGFRPDPTIYHFVALPTSPEVSLEWAKDRWYYTMGDSDIY